MSIGAAAGGAADALTKIIEQRRLQQMLDAEIRNRENLLAESRRSSQADEAYRTRSLDITEQDRRERQEERATAARDKANVRGVQRMAGEFITQHQGPYTPEDVRGFDALQVEMGQTPDIQLPDAPKPPGTHVVNGNLVDDTGKVIFTAPATPDKPGTHVVGGALVDDRGRVIYKAPDAPTSPYTAERQARTEDNARALMGKVNRWTTGFGSLLANIPETEATDFASELDTLKANIMFNELAEMREASKTGGALGQISDREGALLSSAIGALDPRQKPANIKANLQKIVDSVTRWREAQGTTAPRPAARPGMTEPPANQVGGGFVDMIHPDGRSMRVPAADVEKAIAAGARRK